MATRASVGKATIYKHFDSKEDLLLAVVQADL
ncbi:MAG: TetR family transcriptional regulator [Ketobacter sp.]